MANLFLQSAPGEFCITYTVTSEAAQHAGRRRVALSVLGAIAEALGPGAPQEVDDGGAAAPERAGGGDGGEER